MNRKIVKLHGTSGSGKTTVARGLMEMGHVSALGPNHNRPEAYKVDIPGWSHPLYVLGPYTAKCGGM